MTSPRIVKAKVEGEPRLPESATLTELLPERVVQEMIASVVAATDPEPLDDLLVAVEVSLRNATDSGERISLDAFITELGYDPADFSPE
jgi:hypothetical protein